MTQCTALVNPTSDDVTGADSPFHVVGFSCWNRETRSLDRMGTLGTTSGGWLYRQQSQTLKKGAERPSLFAPNSLSIYSQPGRALVRTNKISWLRSSVLSSLNEHLCVIHFSTTRVMESPTLLYNVSVCLLHDFFNVLESSRAGRLIIPDTALGGWSYWLRDQDTRS